MAEYNVSQGAGNVPCDTNEGLDFGGGNVDRFDEMAVRLLGIDRRPPDELLGDGDDHGTMSVRELAAALRETDAKAREEGQTSAVAVALHHPMNVADDVSDDIVRSLDDAGYLTEPEDWNRVLSIVSDHVRSMVGGMVEPAAIREGADACLCHETTVGKTCPLHDVESMARGAGECGTTVPCTATNPCPKCQGGDDAE